MATKVTGGEYKSRALKTPEGKTTRPTGSRVREALFNILGCVAQQKFVDLYAGSGSVGIEASSRGAAEVILVENGRQAIQCIKDNIQLLKASNITLKSMDAEKYCETTPDSSIDILFCDPPFVEVYPDFSGALSLLREGGVAIFQYPTREKISWLSSADKIKKYGESSLAFFYK